MNTSNANRDYRPWFPVDENTYVLKRDLPRYGEVMTALQLWLAEPSAAKERALKDRMKTFALSYYLSPPPVVTQEDLAKMEKNHGPQ